MIYLQQYVAAYVGLLWGIVLGALLIGGILMALRVKGAILIALVAGTILAAIVNIFTPVADFGLSGSIVAAPNLSLVGAIDFGFDWATSSSISSRARPCMRTSPP